jgi:hypothetical protein
MKKALPLALLLLGGCARYPEGGAGSNFARITFRVRVAGRFNTTQDDTPLTNYVYVVAIRAIQGEGIPNTYPPSPVVGSNSPNDQNYSPNGFVAGAPTHFVRFESDRPDQAYPFRLFRFQPVVPTPTNGDNPIDLAAYADTFSSRGPIVQFERPDADQQNSQELTFTVFANQLVDSDDLAPNLRRLQVNILTMNKPATQGTSDRVWDALGDPGQFGDVSQFVTIDLLTNQIVSNVGGIEAEGDTTNGNEPDLDITDFSIQVEQP